MAHADQLTSMGAVENQASNNNRTSSPAPRKLVDTTTGGSDTRVNKTEAKTDPKEPTAGSSKAQGNQVTRQRLNTVRMFCLMLGLAIVLGVGVHVFFGIPSLTKVGVPFEGALKWNRKTGAAPDDHAAAAAIRAKIVAAEEKAKSPAAVQAEL